jgi:hypothetical protein
MVLGCKNVRSILSKRNEVERCTAQSLAQREQQMREEGSVIA